jgi:hypothetical protein
MERVRPGHWFIFLVALLWASPVGADAVAVRLPEGVTHGFLVLRSESGDLLADGELLQVPKGKAVESRLVFRFKDGSLQDETTVFSQDKVFAVIRYHLVQRGPSFAKPLEATLDFATRHFTVKSRKAPDKPEETFDGSVDFPPDVYNGLLPTLAKNLPHGTKARVHFVAFTPEPKVIQLDLEEAGQEQVLVGRSRRRATVYRQKAELGKVLGALASVAGKRPPDSRYWILQGPVPAFLRFEGQLYFEGPVWRVELSSPRSPTRK